MGVLLTAIFNVVAPVLLKGIQAWHTRNNIAVPLPTIDELREHFYATVDAGLAEGVEWRRVNPKGTT